MGKMGENNRITRNAWSLTAMAKLFNFRCPDDLMELIEQRASEAGEDKSRIVIDSLRYALNVTDLPSDAIVGRSKILELIARVEKLEKKQKATIEQLMNA
jgi:hypothetical protein